MRVAPPPSPAIAASTPPQPLAHQARLFGPRDRWVRRWRVASRTVPGRAYTVAVDRAGRWGCSCPGWIYHRARCGHIAATAAIAAGEGR